MQFSSDYTPVWESGATPGSDDFEDSVTLTSTEGDESMQGSNTETNGPLTPTTVVEGTGWSEDDVMLAAQVVNIILFLLLVYETFYGGVGA
ncbi:hypothetical protein [Haloarcula pellucida]|uniref:Uncharacterized protein n=1 Tax=Haloarcula pellucida TaxID=1427151 RepID=A0A830GNC3_9EURY|nr:hypothetical protein [Halomicroarcula pellucida]MBX0348241.1 hypothetical protein [Halomicroarcula pellucida]GGN97644.1 hypothetical protein GCM10009030_27110 [Halomicroarcula pellucida]